MTDQPQKADDYLLAKIKFHLSEAEKDSTDITTRTFHSITAIAYGVGAFFNKTEPRAINLDNNLGLDKLDNIPTSVETLSTLSSPLGFSDSVGKTPEEEAEESSVDKKPKRRFLGPSAVKEKWESKNKPPARERLRTPAGGFATNKPKPRKPVHVPKYVRDWFGVWKSAGLKALPSSHTKSFAYCVQRVRDLANGKITGKAVTIDEWELAVTNFALAALDYNYAPTDEQKTNLQKRSLGDFILSFHGVRYFEKFLNEPPKAAIKPIEDSNPEVTECLVNHFTQYHKDVLKNGDYVPTVVDRNNFIRASERIRHFLDYHKRTIPTAREMLRRPYQQADLLYHSLLETVIGGELTPGYFCSDITFKTRIPKYLRQKEMWEPTD